MSQVRYLYVLVFVVGTGSLGAEIAVARLMAPFFGASTIVWANTIGVVLVALSIGYWFGGRLADRDPSLKGLCRLVLAAAILLAVVPFVARPFFDISVDALDSISAGAFAGSLFAVLALVAVPVMLLGAASPYALRLAVPDVEHAGRISGRLYAVSTAGSLTGTMVSALVLIPFVGTQRTFLVFALLIGATAVAGLGLRFAPAAALIAAALLIPVGTVKPSDSGEVIYETDTESQYVTGRRGAGRRSDPPAQRGPGDPLALQARVLPDRQILGRSHRSTVRGPRGGTQARRDPRQRGRHRGAHVRPLLP